MHTTRYPTIFFLTMLCLLLGVSQAFPQRNFGYAPEPTQYAPPPPQEYVIFNNGNIDAVQNGPSSPTVFSIDRPYTIIHIQNYHYFNYGNPPGSISLRGSDGTRYGPWSTVGEPGQGGVANASWNCYPNVTIGPGTYMVEDSDPATWSQNAASGYRGISSIKARPAY